MDFLHEDHVSPRKRSGLLSFDNIAIDTGYDRQVRDLLSDLPPSVDLACAVVQCLTHPCTYGVDD